MHGESGLGLGLLLALVFGIGSTAFGSGKLEMELGNRRNDYDTR